MGPRTRTDHNALRVLLDTLRDARIRIAAGNERICLQSPPKQGDAALAAAVADHSVASAALADLMLALDEPHAGVPDLRGLEVERVACALETTRPGDEPWTDAARKRLAADLRRLG
jgi:hypothetical protein